MRSFHRFASPRRAGAVAGLALALTVIAAPAGAQSTPPPTPDAQVQQAQQNLAAAQAAAAQANTKLGEVQAALAAAQTQLSDLQAKEAALLATISSDTATVDALNKKVHADQTQLAGYLRASYENGGPNNLEYVLAAGSITEGIQRASEVSHVGLATNILVSRLQAEQEQAKAALAQAQQAEVQLAAARQRAATTEALVAVEEENAAQYANQAAATVQNSAATLQQAQAAQAAQILAAQQAAAAAAAQAAREQARQADVVYSAVAAPGFTADTDLTKPSGLNAQIINTYLAGTDLAGLGDAYMQAESQYHVSARYLVAHSILESDWGQSAIAQQKHNLFGYGADDANPFQDAMSFPDDQTCILFVAQKVSTNYLSPSGPYYHGPTLRGMNVDYASDPLWADKIVRIAQTIPSS